MSQSSLKVSFESLNHLLEQHDVLAHPSQLQGAAIGLLCATDENSARGLWAQYLMNELECEGDEGPEELLGVLGDLFLDCQHQLKTNEYGIEMLAPDDETPISERVESLSHWCEGFLYALGLVGKPEMLKQEDIQDALMDLSQMCQVDEEVEADEDHEKAFMNLVEYARMVPVMVLHHTQSLQKNQETLH